MIADEFQSQDAPTSPASSPSAPAASSGLATTDLTEDSALALLKDRDLTIDQIEQISNSAMMKSRKVRLVLATHPHAPRRLVLRLIREFYTFELMQFALVPAAPADLKRVADELLVSRLTSISLGERLSLARRSSTMVAAALLQDKDPRVWQIALDNARLTEAALVRALQRGGSSPAFVDWVCHHSKWSPRHEVRLALLRNQHTPLVCALDFSRSLPPALLRDVLHTSRLPERIKSQLRKAAEDREKLRRGN